MKYYLCDTCGKQNRGREVERGPEIFACGCGGMMSKEESGERELAGVCAEAGKIYRTIDHFGLTE